MEILYLAMIFIFLNGNGIMKIVGCSNTYTPENDYNTREETHTGLAKAQAVGAWC